MGSRFSCLVAVSALALWALPAAAAQYEKTGNWVFSSKAVAAEGDEMVYACLASTQSVDGTSVTLKLEPMGDAGFDAQMSLSNDAWALDETPVRVRFDIGADHWVLPGTGAGAMVDVAWTGDAGFLTFIEDLASSSFAGLTGRDGTALAQFSLSGSRGAIEAMKACAEAQIGRGLAETFEAGAPDVANPF